MELLWLRAGTEKGDVVHRKRPHIVKQDQLSEVKQLNAVILCCPFTFLLCTSFNVDSSCRWKMRLAAKGRRWRLQDGELRKYHCIVTREKVKQVKIESYYLSISHLYFFSVLDTAVADAGS